MSTRDEEARAIEAARTLLGQLSSGEYKVTSIRKLRADARQALRHFPLAASYRWMHPDGITRVRELTGAVITAHEGIISTHSESCHEWHAGCLAHRVERIISDHYGNGDTNE